jgi:hypothetical protein
MAGSPLDRLASVDGSGALAGCSPLALRFRAQGDSTRHKEFSNGAANRFRLRNAVPFLQSLQTGGHAVVNEERVTLPRAHVKHIVWSHAYVCQTAVAGVKLQLCRQQTEQSIE